MFGLMFWPFITSLVLAALFASALSRYVDRLVALKIKRAWASLILILSLLVFVVTPLTLVVLQTISLIRDYSSVGIKNTSIYISTEQLLHQITQYGSEVAQRFDVDLSRFPTPVDLLNSYSDEFGARATRFLSSLPQFGLNLFVFILALYFFLSQAHKIKEFFISLKFLSPHEGQKTLRIIQNSAHLTMVAALMIGLLQALIIASFAYFCDYDQFALIFIITAITSLIPVVGSAPLSLFLAVMSFIQGHTGAGVAMLIAAGLSGSVDNLLKPIILNAGERELHPVLSLLSLIGAILIYGAPGILLGPVITQLALNMLPVFEADQPKESEPAL